MLPQPTIALLFPYTTLFRSQLPGVLTSLTSSTVGVESHRSEAVGAVKLGAAGQEMVASAPGDPIGAGLVSSTRMVSHAVADSLPKQSLAFQVLVRSYTPGQA